MASPSALYERKRSTYQHLIWFTLDWIHLLLNCPQFQKIVKPIWEYFFTRNRKLYALIKSLQRVTEARKGAFTSNRPTGFSTRSVAASFVIDYFLSFSVSVSDKRRAEMCATVSEHVFQMRGLLLPYVISIDGQLLQVLSGS